MISYVWNVEFMLRPGVGGTENFTLGHVRELIKRGIETEIITLQGEEDGSHFFPDIPFRTLTLAQLAQIDNPVVFACIPAPMKTKNTSFAYIHYPVFANIPPKQVCLENIDGKVLIVPSQATAAMWAKYLNLPLSRFCIVYPFAMPDFGEVPVIESSPDAPKKVLFASRLSPEKGIYTFMAALHTLVKQTEFNFTFSVTTNDEHRPDGKIIKEIAVNHPLLNVVPACTTTAEMAKLMAQYDIVVVPSSKLWSEPFGMVSVEAQHAGCRVVGTNYAGLPETDCGGLVLVEPDNHLALAKGILEAARLGRLSPKARQAAAQKYTIKDSVDAFLDVINKNSDVTI